MGPQAELRDDGTLDTVIQVAEKTYRYNYVQSEFVGETTDAEENYQNFITWALTDAEEQYAIEREEVEL